MTDLISHEQVELTYEERVRWFVNNYYETGMEYASMLESMKNEDLDNFVWYGEKIQIPKFYNGEVNLYTEKQIIEAFKYAYLIGEDDISEDDAELQAKEYIQSLKQNKKD